MGAYGAGEYQCPGRVIMDMLRLIPKERKFRSYKLNNVAAMLLGDQKEDLPHQMITPLWEGTKANRARIATYCIKDSELCLMMMDKLYMVYNYAEMARATGVTIRMLIFGGQMGKVMSLIYRQCKELNFLVPFYKYDSESGEDSFDGAVVLEPKRGFYKDPVPTLDFASLYPSIMTGGFTFIAT